VAPPMNVTRNSSAVRMSGILISGWLLTVMAAAREPVNTVIPLASFDSFQAALGAFLPDAIRENRRLSRQIAPSVRWTLVDHADAIGRLPQDRQRRSIAALAAFIIEARRKHAANVVIGPGRPITALLDPDQGLDPKQITALAAAYRTKADVLKRHGEQTLADVAEAFLAAVADRAAAEEPATVVVVGHGLPKEIQSYAIPVGRVASALVDGAIRREKAGESEGGASVDLSNLVLLFDDCFSADFCLNLARGIRSEAVRRGALLHSLPVLVAGANRDRYGLVNIGEKFVTHYWESVIELYFVRKPHPAAVTLGDFQGHIDNFMYGYGRAPVFEGTRIVSHRLVDPDLVQDPVCFLPLTADEVERLRSILGLAEQDDLLPIIDAG